MSHHKSLYSRRKFLKFGGILLSAPLITTVPYVQAQSKPTIILSSNQQIGALSAVLMRLFFGFLTDVGANLVANRVSDWIDDLTGNNQDRAARRDVVMENIGFTDDSQSRVHLINGNNNRIEYNYSYGREFHDESNACIAFQHPAYEQKVALAEGPIIVGLSAAAKEWEAKKTRLARPYSIQEALVPVRQLAIQGSAPLTASFARPHVYETQAGVIGFDYDFSSRQQTGELIVTAVDAEQNELFHSEYEVTV